MEVVAARSQFPRQPGDLRRQQRFATASTSASLDLVERIIRDHLVEDTDRLIVDHRDIYRKVQRFLGLYLPGQKVQTKLHQERTSLAEKFDIEKEIERTFQKNVFS